METYIQSGNAIARSREADPAAIAQTVGAALQPLGYAEPVLVLPSADLRAVIAQAPVDFGSDPKVHRYDVLFPLDRARARSAVSEVPCNPVVDAIWAGDGALYYRRLISQASKSHLSRLVKLPLYKRLTIRNWATTTRLMAMLSARPS